MTPALIFLLILLRIILHSKYLEMLSDCSFCWVVRIDDISSLDRGNFRGYRHLSFSLASFFDTFLSHSIISSAYSTPTGLFSIALTSG
ncbi:hypothetical protein BDZ97DRAFT_1212435 [Flammula alnicola]|nr:hypothetical protein BDZ97DRAFT_1212435 [Flammula alnicola]